MEGLLPCFFLLRSIGGIGCCSLAAYNAAMVNRREFLLGCVPAGLLLARLGPLRGSAWSEEPTGTSQDLAHDPLRPACHLLPPHNWMNDPNGPIWWKGKYHLFYQLNPHAAVWGDMHWGHAVSSDMIHWHHELTALAPTPGGPDRGGCFSGSAVVLDGVPTFFYTGIQEAPPDQVTIHDGSEKWRETQLTAKAEDDGLLHWKKQAEPVLPTPPQGIKVTGFRDPCVWREHDGWYMGVGCGERGVGGFVLLYHSRDGHQWQYLHKLAEGKPNGKHTVNPCDSGEMWECPDFFPLGQRHCLFYSTEGKVIWTTGDYDTRAHHYTHSSEGVLDRGAYYAPKSFTAPDGRRILWGWIRETRPEAAYAAAGWSGVMSFPRELSVGAKGELQMRPAREVESLRGPEQKSLLKPDAPLRRNLDALQYEVQVPLNSPGADAVKVELQVEQRPVWELVIDWRAKEVRSGNVRFELPSDLGKSSLRILLDGSVIESFIGDREALTSRVYDLKPGATSLVATLAGKGEIAVQSWPLKPISADRLTT